MKKAIAILMVLGVLLSLCACGSNSGSPATIVDQSGNSVQMTADELCDIYSENSAKFYNQYQSASITATGTVKKVEASAKMFGTDQASTYVITMNEGWELTVLEDGHDEVINLSKGDKIKFTSTIQSCFAGKVELYDVGYNHGLIDYSTIKKV